jgi:uncharacterized membrane protein
VTKVEPQIAADPLVIAPVSALALDEGALDALVEVLLGDSPAGRQARRGALVLVGSFSFDAAAFRRAAVQHPRTIAAVVRLIKQPDNVVQRQAAFSVHRAAVALGLPRRS